ncbi:hypothetical protein E2C01_080165 [Portunus trituberculatus]|uniref:Uncharacterized protein n=1 Tax=Portunus trituberculatus TaxID=210409 RepID=A0A5B7ISP9_PORTR|nr:hypothetical protein [Portunus trituberculatus]
MADVEQFPYTHVTDSSSLHSINPISKYFQCQYFHNITTDEVEWFLSNAHMIQHFIRYVSPSISGQ